MKKSKKCYMVRRKCINTDMVGQASIWWDQPMGYSAVYYKLYHSCTWSWQPKAELCYCSKTPNESKDGHCDRKKGGGLQAKHTWEKQGLVYKRWQWIGILGTSLSHWDKTCFTWKKKTLMRECMFCSTRLGLHFTALALTHDIKSKIIFSLKKRKKGKDNHPHYLSLPHWLAM